MDALHTQRHTAREQGGHYLMGVTANQPALYQALQEGFAQPAWFGEHVEQVTTFTKGHGRHEWRTLERRAVVKLPWDWPGVQQAPHGGRSGHDRPASGIGQLWSDQLALAAGVGN